MSANTTQVPAQITYKSYGAFAAFFPLFLNSEPVFLFPKEREFMVAVSYKGERRTICEVFPGTQNPSSCLLLESCAPFGGAPHSSLETHVPIPPHAPHSASWVTSSTPGTAGDCSHRNGRVAVCLLQHFVNLRSWCSQCISACFYGKPQPTWAKRHGSNIKDTSPKQKGSLTNCIQVTSCETRVAAMSDGEGMTSCPGC